jgi:hypothetical protein
MTSDPPELNAILDESKAMFRTALRQAYAVGVTEGRARGFRIKELPLGRTTVWKLIQEGKLRTVGEGHRKIVPHEVWQAYLNAPTPLPGATP